MGCIHERALDTPSQTMPTYLYQCRSCQALTEVIHRFSAPGPKTCSQCGAKSPARVFGVPNVNTVDTVGQQAERNMKRLGREKTQLLNGTIGPAAEARQKREDEAKKNAPWWRKGKAKPVDLRKVRDAKRYIREGRTD